MNDQPGHCDCLIVGQFSVCHPIKIPYCHGPFNDPVTIFILLHRQFFGRPDGAPGLSRVMVDAFNIIQDRIARSRLAGDPPDITIAPRLGDIGLFDFHRAAEAVPLGLEATEREIEEIERAVYALAA